MAATETVERWSTVDPRAAATERTAVGVSVTTAIMLALLLMTFVKQLVHVVVYPPFQGHDEVSHLGYLRVLAEEGRLPHLWDQLPAALEPYSRYTLDWPALYTANHPPLYYVLALPFYWLAGSDYESQLYAVRLAAIPFFLLTIWLVYRTAALLLPGDRFLALTAPAVVAMQPQLSFEGAIVNNDMLSIFFGTLILYWCIRILRHGLSIGLAAALGVSCGLGLLSKATLTALLPVVAGVALWMTWPRPVTRFRDARWWREATPKALALAIPTVLIPLPWYLFLNRTYGDFTAFEATQDLQRNWNRSAGTFTELLFSGDFHTERLRETWGFYGWKLLPLTDGEQAAIVLGLLVCIAGIVVGLLRFAARNRHQLADRALVAGIVVLAAACVVMYAATIYFGTMFLLTQARYFFPVLPAAIVLAMLGVRAMTPSRWRMPAAAVVIAIVTGFQVLLMTRLVLPYATG
jgi:4-amino-4-deoxy-L-arabinose transferase-like glycosyltransferase